MSAILDIKNLTIVFETELGDGEAVSAISFNIKKGQVTGLVGESGCGKSVTSLSILNLLPKTARISNGEILFTDINILKLPQFEMRKLRGNKITLIPQDPLTSLNPVYTIGDQIMEVLILHKKLDKKQAKLAAIDILRQVNIPQPETRIHDYPHQLSGGMRQRVLIAIALCCTPDLIIADEPTTALDVTVQAQILNLMKDLLQSHQTALLLITHDLGVISEMADEVLIMYAGEIVEHASKSKILMTPSHPYTQALLKSIPNISSEKIQSIKGQPPSIYDQPQGCRFAPRCESVFDKCYTHQPTLTKIDDDHSVRCFLYDNK